MDFYGSLCLSDIPARLIKEGKDGKKYLNINIVERKKPSEYGETHFIAASCKKEDQIEGENRFIGGCQPFVQKAAGPTPQDIDNMPVAENKDDLPF